MLSIGLIFGPNGSGKGTLANGLSHKLSPNYVHLNSGKLIREWANKNNRKDLIDSIDNGNFVDDKIVKIAWDSEISIYNKKNLIIEGFPRKYSQNRILKYLIKKYKYKISWIINLYLPEKNVIERISNRLQDLKTGDSYHLIYNPPPKDMYLESRKDDVPVIAKKRFEFFISMTLVTLSYPKFLDVPLINIDARKSIEEVLNVSYDFIINHKI